MFYEDFKVRFTDLDSNHRASARAILNYCEECAILHGEDLGIGLEYVMKEQKGWILTKSLLHIVNPLFFQQKLRVESWITSFSSSGIQVTREYHIFDEQGLSIAHRRAQWVHMDLTNRQLVSMSDELRSKIVIEPVLFTQPFCRLEHQSATAINEYPVLWSQIDLNQHVNNIYYLDWILQSIDPKIITSFSPIIIETHFINELYYGDSVKISTNKGDDNYYNYAEKNSNDLIFNHTIYRGDGKVSASFSTVWKYLKD